MLVLNPYPQTPFHGKGAILLGLPPLDQARMLAVSHTKPLHDAVAQMADDLYGGYAPATPFLSTIEVFRQSETGIGIYRCPFFCLLPVESYVKPPYPVFCLQEICENLWLCFRAENRTITEDELYNNEKGNEVSR